MELGNRWRNALTGAAAIAALTLIFPSASAQTYPDKPVQMITPAAAGNSPDVATRIVADKLAQLWKQQVVVVNRPGAGGLIAAQAAAGVVPDGYTLYMTQASTYTVLPIHQKPMPLDLDRAFVPIGLVAEQPIAITVTPALGVNTLPELIAKVKATPGGMLFAATNRGGQSHLTGELFRARTGLNLTFVHAPSLAASLVDVSAGRIPILFEGLAGVSGAVQHGTLKLIAIATAKRLPNLPDLPTFAETIPGFESKGWLLLMAPRGTPDAIINKVNADLATVLALPDVQQKFAALGTFAHHLSPADSAAYIKSEEDLWWPVVRTVEGEKK